MRSSLLLTLAVLGLSACAGTPGQDTSRAVSSTATAARDIGTAASSIAGSAVETTTRTASDARMRAEILAMPKTQPGWIEPSPATAPVKVGLPPLAPVVSGPIGSQQVVETARYDPSWNYDLERNWRVRLADGRVFPVQQAGPRMKVGQEVMVVRYGARLALVP